ncbi:IscS subfamily cysteine desulfurase [Siphonobacter sp. BAB-5405]|uniref:cysteine desulfurase family protein n=1 Tax=Siphonobacter sp. BAB-5405 TaxID=1864825 RepID=UPI000C805669|nr:cysteine desulfurase family protein [Siphonobacter sp. BAB-5405]PMD98248.1 IscS subfamily cysteine desulfurase [Siphonobacter sp. BAB-5405]
MNRPIYLDYNATTPVDSRVLQTMLPWFTEQFGNAASRTHLYGWEAAEAVEIARRQVARILGATEKEIVFTSGATESNNLALTGVFEASSKKHFITVQTEHKAILDVCTHLEKLGGEVTYLAPDTDGLITAQQVSDALRPDTALVSVMWANNETGVIQSIRELARICNERGVLFHSDATQAVGKLPVSVEGIDLLSLSAHKLYGPKGIGALYVRKGTPLSIQMHGGGHERGRRSGTLNVPGIVGLGKAAELAQQTLTQEAERLAALRDQLETQLLQQIPGTRVNGSQTSRLPQVSNLAFEAVDGEALLINLTRIAVSNGSACTSASVLPSHVLKAMGLSDDLAHASVRFSLGRYTTEEDIAEAISHVVAMVAKTRTDFLVM